jgi:hypothetical protein
LKVLNLLFCWQVAEHQQQQEEVVVMPDAIARQWVEQALKDIEANKVRQARKDGLLYTQNVLFVLLGGYGGCAGSL